jgi:hypothetical protein
VIDTNITGTVYLIHKVGNDMRRRNAGRILITGSIAGFIPGSFQAVYNGTKAFLNSFSFALREELKDTKVTVTCLMPGATDTEFFRRAEMMDTDVGTTEKDDAAEVAKNGFDAMMKGEGDVVSGFKNKIQSAAANVIPAGVLASQHPLCILNTTGGSRLLIANFTKPIRQRRNNIGKTNRPYKPDTLDRMARKDHLAHILTIQTLKLVSNQILALGSARLIDEYFLP